MYKAKQMLFIYVEENLHAGTGRGMGAVDLPIQRERSTDYPKIQASSVKGKLRAIADPEHAVKKVLDENVFLAVFGPKNTDYAGAVAVCDARILLFAVRSLAGVFSWITSMDVLQRFYRDMNGLGIDPALDLDLKCDGKALVADESKLIISAANPEKQRIILEEYALEYKMDPKVSTLAKWIAKNALPDLSEYKYWKSILPEKLCILPDDDFRDFVKFSTVVETHIRLNPNTKTVDQGMLWTSESLPTDSLMYVPVFSSPPRTDLPALRAESKHNAEGMLEKFAEVVKANPRIQLGGDETTGQGMVALRIIGGTK